MVLFKVSYDRGPQVSSIPSDDHPRNIPCKRIELGVSLVGVRQPVGIAGRVLTGLSGCLTRFLGDIWGEASA